MRTVIYQVLGCQNCATNFLSVLKLCQGLVLYSDFQPFAATVTSLVSFFSFYFSLVTKIAFLPRLLVLLNGWCFLWPLWEKVFLCVTLSHSTLPSCLFCVCCDSRVSLSLKSSRLREVGFCHFRLLPPSFFLSSFVCSSAVLSFFLKGVEWRIDVLNSVRQIAR